MGTGAQNPENQGGDPVTRLTNQFRQQAEQSVGGMLNPMNWGIFGWIFAGLALFMGFTDTGRGWWNQLTGWLAETFPSLAGLLGGSQAQAALNHAEFPQVRTILERHNIALGTNTMSELAGNPNALFEVLTTTPAFVRDMTSGQNGGGMDDATKARLMGSVRQILGNETQVNTLLSAQHRANTIALLERFSPIRFPAGNLDRFIREAGMNGNTLKPEMRQLLIGMLGTEAERDAAFQQLGTTIDITHIRNLFQGVDLNQIPARIRPQIQMVVENPELARAGQAIERDLAARGTSIAQIQAQMVDAQGNLSMPQVVAFMLNGANRDIMRPHTEAIRQLAETGARDTTRNYTAEQRAAMTFMATNAGGPVNVNALLSMFDTIGRNPYNNSSPAAGQRAHAVITGMMGIITGDENLVGLLNADNVSQFFSDPQRQNAAAFGRMLNSLNTDALTPAMRTAVANLRSHWGNASSGLVDVLDDRASVQYMLENRNTQQSSMTSWMPYSWQAALGGIVGVPDDIRQNLEHLDVVRQALAAARGR